MSGSSQTTELRVVDMDCPSCLQKIRGHLEGVEGVGEIEGSVVQRTLRIHHERALNPDRLTEEIGRLGYRTAEVAAGVAPVASSWSTPEAHRTYLSTALFAVGLALLLSGWGPAFYTSSLHSVGPAQLLLLASALVGGWNFFPRGILAFRRLALDMNALMTVAIVGAVVIGEFVEAAAIAFLFSLAELLESYAVDRARASVESLMKLAPDSARLLDGGEERMVDASSLRVGDRIRVRPGERIAADGRVVEGASAIDESAITGESLPVDRETGDPVFAGTINHSGALTVEVEKEAGRSTLARIIELIEEAETRKSRSERFIERFARYYTPVVVAGALLVVAVPTLFLGAPFLPWFVRGLTLLVIACPCALVLSTPVAVVSGITAAARNGVLIKGGVHLEAIASICAVAFDKTGTLTVGHPEVRAVTPTGPVSESELLAAAAAVEADSQHPIARAIREAAEDRGLAVPAASDFEALHGRGAVARIGAVRWAVGRPEELPDAPPLAPEVAGEGITSVGVSREGEFLGWIAVADRMRDEAPEVIRALRQAGVGTLVMLTGDRRETAERIGAQFGVDRVEADLFPESKVDLVEELEASLGPVAMVGDGVNDGPALARATVGIAMGAAGSDAALEIADVALMGDELGRLPYLFELARKARGVIRQNVAVALGVKAILVLGVPLGQVSLIGAVVVGDLGVSLAVILNALRLGRVRT